MIRNWLGLGVAAVVVSAVGLAFVAFTHLAAQPAMTARLGAPWDGAGGGLASRALSAETVIVGKVASFEKETVEALGTGPATPATMVARGGGGGFDPSGKVKYTIANVKIEDGLLGAKSVTHVKVGFVKGVGAELAEGGQYLLFLSKHPTEGFYVMPARTPAVSAKDDEAYKKAVAEVKKVAAVVADPVAALKAEKAADRGAAAALLLGRYRARPQGGFDEVELSAEESRLLLKGLADADWTSTPPDGTSPLAAFLSLRLTEKEGWKPSGGASPSSIRAGGGADVYAEWKKAFAVWIDGPGKDYRVKKLVPKK